MKNYRDFSVTINMLCISLLVGLKTKKPIQTKFRMPMLNWQTLQPTQVKDTVFNELDDEQVLGVRIRFVSNITATYVVLRTATYAVSAFVFICY